MPAGELVPTSQDERQISGLAQYVLAKAALKLGGAAALARHLKVSDSELTAWMDGTQLPPADLVLRAVNPLLRA